MFSKNGTNILMGFKIVCQVGGRGKKFQNYNRWVTLKIFDLKIRLFNFITRGRHFFAKNANLLALTILTLNPYRVHSGSKADLHTRPEGPSCTDGTGY